MPPVPAWATIIPPIPRPVPANPLPVEPMGASTGLEWSRIRRWSDRPYCGTNLVPQFPKWPVDDVLPKQRPS